MSKSSGTGAREAKVIKKGSNVTNIADKQKKTSGDQPKEPYDELNQPSQDKFDAIVKMGFRPDKLERGWIAREMHGDRHIGPFEHIGILFEEVKTEVGTKPAALPEGVEMVDEENDGQKRLPTMAVPSVKVLDALIRKRAAAVAEFTAASAKVQEINKECLDAFEQQKQHFVLYPEKNKHIYKSQAGGELRIKHSVTDTVETVLEDED